MKKSIKKPNGSKQRLQKESLFVFSADRAKTYSLLITPKRKITITVRKFRLSSKSKTAQELRINLSVLGVRQVAIHQKVFKRPKYTLSSVLNKNRHMSPAQFIIICGVVGMVVFGVQLLESTNVKPPIALASNVELNAQEIQEIKKVKTLPRSAPIMLQVPQISLKSEIQKIGLLPNGELETPDIFSDKVGWYKFGVTPGEIGAAVIAGHVDNYEGPSVFWRLGELRTKDKIYVTRKDGSKATFIVTSVEQFNQDEFPTERVYGDVNYAGLRLITCGGSFSPLSGEYSHNTIVFARLIES